MNSGLALKMLAEQNPGSTPAGRLQAAYEVANMYEGEAEEAHSDGFWVGVVCGVVLTLGLAWAGFFIATQLTP